MVNFILVQTISAEIFHLKQVIYILSASLLLFVALMVFPPKRPKKLLLKSGVKSDKKLIKKV